MLPPAARCRLVTRAPGAALAPLLLLLLLAGLGWPAWAEGPAPEGFVDLLVARRAEVPVEQARVLFRAAGAEEVGEIAAIRVHRLRVRAGAAEALAGALALRAELLFVEADLPFAPEALPNDPLYPEQWHLPQIGAEAAWALVPAGGGVVIAILDTGVTSTHEDLASRLVPGTNTYDGTDTEDVHGHGTKVAGTAAAQANNGVGVASVAPTAWLMPIRVTGSDGLAWASTLGAGLTWAADHGARVANLSFQGVAASATVKAAAQYMVEQGGLVVAGSGNLGTWESIAETPWIVSVAATDANDARASFSSSGAYVDLAAPGVNIRTTKRISGYAWGSGTSYSGPVVAGVAALMWAANPALLPADVETVLEATAQDLGPEGWDPEFGYGRVDAGEAVWAAWLLAHPPQCRDGLDNDGDGRIDYPADPQCLSPDHPSEVRAACGLGFELALLLPLLMVWRRRREPRLPRSSPPAALQAAGPSVAG